MEALILTEANDWVTQVGGKMHGCKRSDRICKSDNLKFPDSTSSLMSWTGLWFVFSSLYSRKKMLHPFPQLWRVCFKNYTLNVQVRIVIKNKLLKVNYTSVYQYNASKLQTKSLRTLISPMELSIGLREVWVHIRLYIFQGIFLQKESFTKQNMFIHCAQLKW